MSRNWKLTPWTSGWKRQYEEESAVLRTIFCHEIVDIQHVGSTSVPAIGFAKPVIDILLAVRDIGKVDDRNEFMKSAGYRVRGENGIRGRRYFTKGDAPRTHHVHIYQQGDPKLRTYLDFKAYLLEHPVKAAEYGRLKLDILATHPQDEYQREKERRMARLVEEALMWGASGGRRP